MGSITKVQKVDKTTGKTATKYRAFIRRTGYESKSKVLDTKAQAKEWLRNNEADTGLVKLTQGHGRTFEDIVEDFIKAPATKGTKYWAASHLDFWIAEFGKLKIGAISRGDINAAKANLQIKKAMLGIPGGVKEMDREVTPATVNRYLASLSSVMNYAMAREIIDVHPMKGGKVSKLTEGNGRTRILKPDEEQRLYEAAEGATWPMMRLFLRMLLTTAARKTEVLNLRWQDVDLDNSVAILPTTKNEDPRALPLVGDVKLALIEARKILPMQNDFVFFDPKHPEKPKNVDVVWNHVRRRAGLFQDREDKLDRVVLHTTRHTAATKMLKGGANLAQAAKVTGHKTLAMLNRYTHLDAKDSIELAEKHLAG